MSKTGAKGTPPSPFRALVFEEACAFFAEAHRLWPAAHLRLYTTGDGLTQAMLRRLIACGLSEIRFSIKGDDDASSLAETMDTIAMACNESVDAMIEMPVIPGTLEEMKNLLVSLDNMGVKGINLLEFCYLMHNWPEFERRGFVVRNPPFEVPYNYGYAGSLPIDGSELEALELCRFALEKGLTMGIHYCSLENKHRDQILTQNSQTDVPIMAMNPDTFFYECLKAYGADAEKIRASLEGQDGEQWSYDKADCSIAFHPALLPFVPTDVALGLSTNVVETRGDDLFIRELALAPFKEA